MTKSMTTLLIAGPLSFLGLSATAGGMTEPVMTPPPAPVAVAPVPVATGSNWSGFYAGAGLGFAQVETDAFEEDGEDLTFGAHAGYLYDLGSFVLGAELEYDATEVVDDGSEIALDGVARAKIRAGYDAGAFLPYVTAGAAQAYTSGGLDADDTGAFAGVGVDYQFSDTIRLGAEVLRHQFEDFGGSGADIDATTASLRVGFSF